MNYQAWIWTELLAFDNTQKDQGVHDYLNKIDFVPEVICLLLSSPDFVLLHKGLEHEDVLPPDICSRDAQPGNEERQRQDWTNFELKSLINNLHYAGIKVYISMFTRFHQNKFHKEWVDEHLEVQHVVTSLGVQPYINYLARLDNGSYFEDFFITQVVKTTVDYGFDGWHGPDGHGPGPSIWFAYFSDDMMGQFQDYLKKELPEIITCDSGNQIEILQKRVELVWNEFRTEWIEFHEDRWSLFWRKMVTALHEQKKKAVINSAWTRACFEASYRYGIDYRKIAETGVDAIIVETVAANLCLYQDKPDRHFDFLAMLMEIKAYIPDTKLIFLHGIKDVKEEYDLLRHAPTMLEREVYSLANVYYNTGIGTLKRCTDGFMACLGDGISAEEWKWLKKRWDTAFAYEPEKVGELTFVWSDKAFSNYMCDYMENGNWSAHKQLYSLLECGVQIQSTVRIENLSKVAGPLIAFNYHLFPEDELNQLLNYNTGPVILLGACREGMPSSNISIIYENEVPIMSCLIYGIGNGEHKINICGESIEKEFIEEKISKSFKDDISWRDIPNSFWHKVTEIIINSIKNYKTENSDFYCSCALEEDNKIKLMSLLTDDKSVQIALKNSSLAYVDQEVELNKNISSIKVLNAFPAGEKIPDNNKFTTKVPGRGISILEVNF